MDDIWELIFNVLNTYDFLKMRLINKYFNHIICNRNMITKHIVNMKPNNAVHLKLINYGKGIANILIKLDLDRNNIITDQNINIIKLYAEN